MEPQPELAPTSTSKRDLWLEVGAVLFMTMIPVIAGAIRNFVEKGPAPSAPSSDGRWLRTIASGVYVSIPVLYIMWRSREGWATFGLAKPRWATDAALGLGLFVLEKAV